MPYCYRPPIQALAPRPSPELYILSKSISITNYISKVFQLAYFCQLLWTSSSKYIILLTQVIEIQDRPIHSEVIVSQSINQSVNQYWKNKHISMLGNVTATVQFIHSGYFYSASSIPLLLRSTPDTSRILCRSFTPKGHKLLRVKDLPKVPTWRIRTHHPPVETRILAYYVSGCG